MVGLVSSHARVEGTARVKLVVTSDWHGDWSTLGVRRHDEVARAVDESVDVAINENAGAYICLGDVADPDTGGDTCRAQLLAMNAACRLARHGIKSIWLRGNHDVWEDGTNACVLTPMRALEDNDMPVFVADHPRVVWLDDGLAVLCLPFMPVSHAGDIEMAAASLFPTLNALGHKIDTPPRVIVISHLTVPGVVAGEETKEMPRGREVIYPFASTKDAVLRLQGHYHARQQFEPNDGGPPLIIPGSLARLTFGDEDHDPGFLVIDV